MSETKHVFGTLDGIRGVAAMLVMLVHLPYLCPWSMGQAYLAVDLFFALSGVVICRAYEGRIVGGMPLGKFFYLRMVRLYPLYVLGTLIKVAGYLALHKVDLTIFTLGLAMLPNLQTAVLYPLNEPAWSLFTEIIANICFFLLLRYATVTAQAGVALVSAGGLAWVALTAGGVNVGWSAETLAPAFFRVGYSFFGGALLYKLVIAPRLATCKPATSPVAPWLVLGAVGLLLCVNVPPAFQGWYELLVVLLAFPLLVVAAALMRETARTSRVFAILGALSYPIYVLHVPLGAAYARGYELLARTQEAPGPFFNALFLLVFFGACAALVRFWDSPVRAFLNRLALPRPTIAGARMP